MILLFRRDEMQDPTGNEELHLLPFLEKLSNIYNGRP